MGMPLVFLLLSFAFSLVIPDSAPTIGWTRFGNFYYIVHTDKGRTFLEAERHCSSTGAHLASIHISAENLFVESLIYNSLPKSNITAWIGAFRAAATERFLWVDGTPMDFSDWLTGKPEIGSSEPECSVMFIRQHHPTKSFHWVPRSCNIKLNAVCKMPAFGEA